MKEEEKIEKFYCECKNKYHFYNRGNGVMCGVCNLPVREEYIKEHLLGKEVIPESQLELSQPEVKEDKASEEWKERESIWDRLAPLSAMQELVGNNTPFEKIIDGVGREILLDFIESEKQKSELELIDRIRKEWIKVREKMDIPYGEDDEKNFYEGYCEGYNQGITDIAKEVCKFEDLISNERKDK